MRDIIKYIAEVQHRGEREYADVAELADALDSGSSGSDTVGVQAPSSAPKSRMLWLNSDKELNHLSTVS